MIASVVLPPAKASDVNYFDKGRFRSMQLGAPVPASQIIGKATVEALKNLTNQISPKFDATHHFGNFLSFVESFRCRDLTMMGKGELVVFANLTSRRRCFCREAEALLAK